MKWLTILACCALSSALFLTAQGQIIDEPLLEEIEKAGFLYFWEQAGTASGQVKDRSLLRGNPDPRDVSSIAATGLMRAI